MLQQKERNKEEAIDSRATPPSYKKRGIKYNI
jgi:hypothetical protein